MRVLEKEVNMPYILLTKQRKNLGNYEDEGSIGGALMETKSKIQY